MSEAASRSEVRREGGQPRRPLVVLVLSVLGALVSAYLVYEHFTSATRFACPETGGVNCVKVTTSEYSVFLGVPIAVLGLGFFLAMTAMSWPSLWRRPVLRGGRLVASVVGVLFVLRLVWVELFRIDAICLWCTAIHVIVVVLFAVLAVDAALTPRA